MAVMTISDTGAGIAPELQAHIFEPFFTTKERGKGNGLGLATVFGIVQQHQGHIQLQSQQGQGSQFILAFPLSASLPSPSQSVSARISYPPPAQQAHLILLVEDEHVVREVVRRTLLRLGYQVIEAENGPAALRLFEERGHEVALLLTDMNMPGGMSGRQLAEQLLAKRPDLKVIYSTGYSEDALDEQFSLDENRNFLAKPYSPQRLAELLKVNLET
jgi:CheY-like chemotaxis protein